MARLGESTWTWFKRQVSWTRLGRRLRLFVRGSFKKRFPIKCDQCGKPSRYEGAGDTIHIQSTFEPCGHTYTFWRQLREEARRKLAVKTAKTFEQHKLAKRRYSEGSKNGWQDDDRIIPGSGVDRPQ